MNGPPISSEGKRRALFPINASRACCDGCARCLSPCGRRCRIQRIILVHIHTGFALLIVWSMVVGEHIAGESIAPDCLTFTSNSTCPRGLCDWKFMLGVNRCRNAYDTCPELVKAEESNGNSHFFHIDVTACSLHQRATTTLHPVNAQMLVVRCSAASVTQVGCLHSQRIMFLWMIVVVVF